MTLLIEKYNLYNPKVKTIKEAVKNEKSNKEDLDYFLTHQSEAPKEWREFYVFFNVLHPDNSESVAFVSWRGDRWVQAWIWLGSDWGGRSRVLRVSKSLDSGKLETSPDTILANKSCVGGDLEDRVKSLEERMERISKVIKF